MVTVFLAIVTVAGLSEVLIVFFLAAGVKITALTCLRRWSWGKRNKLIAFICSPCRKMLPVLMSEEQPSLA